MKTLEGQSIFGKNHHQKTPKQKQQWQNRCQKRFQESLLEFKDEVWGYAQF